MYHPKGNNIIEVKSCYSCILLNSKTKVQLRSSYNDIVGFNSSLCVSCEPEERSIIKFRSETNSSRSTWWSKKYESFISFYFSALLRWGNNNKEEIKVTKNNTTEQRIFFSIPLHWWRNLHCIALYPVAIGQAAFLHQSTWHENFTQVLLSDSYVGDAIESRPGKGFSYATVWVMLEANWGVRITVASYKSQYWK